MKHIFNTLLSLVTICLPGCIFAKNFPLLDGAARYIPPHKAHISGVQERDEVPVLLVDSFYCAFYNMQTGNINNSYWTWNEYDEENRINVSSTTRKNQFNSESRDRTTNFYNSNGDIALSKVAIKNGANWIAKSQTIYTYDNNHYLIEIKQEDYISGEISRSTFINNADGFSTEERLESLINNVWTLGSKFTYPRNADNKFVFIKAENYNLETGEILSGDQYIYEYDAAGNTTLELSQSLNTITSEWVNSVKDVSIFTANNLLATFERSIASSADPTIWEPQELILQNYKNQTELDSLIVFNWDGTNWEPLSLTLHQYANGQLIKDSTYNWSANQWDLTYRNLHKPADDIYSIAFGISEGNDIQNNNNGNWNTILVSKREYSDLGNNLVQLESLRKSLNSLNVVDTAVYCNEYYHRISPVSTNQALTNQSTTLAPNPYKTGQTIRCIGLENSTDLTFSLYDIAGTLISEQTFDGGTGLVLPAKVKAGMYIAVISQGAQRLKTTKIVVVDAP